MVNRTHTFRIARRAGTTLPGESVTDNDYETNAGDVVAIEGVVTVVDQDGNILCQEPLTNMQTSIQGGAIFLNSMYSDPQQGSVDTDVDLTTNPVVFGACPGAQYAIAMIGIGCTEYEPGPVTIEGTLSVLTSTVSDFPGNVPAPTYINKYFSFQAEDGTMGQITFGGIVNNTSATVSYGFLQIVTSSVRSATLADNSVQYIASFNTNALDDNNDAVMSPVQEGVPSGNEPFDLTLPDSPGFAIVDNWILKGEYVQIQSYSIKDAFSAFLMSLSSEPGAQWVPVAQVDWSVQATLRRVAAPKPGTPRWEVDPSGTLIVQPTTGLIPTFPQQPVWNGTAQTKVLAQISGNAYQPIMGQNAVRTESVRY